MQKNLQILRKHKFFGKKKDGHIFAFFSFSLSLTSDLYLSCHLHLSSLSLSFHNSFMSLSFLSALSLSLFFALSCLSLSLSPQLALCLFSSLMSPCLSLSHNSLSACPSVLAALTYPVCQSAWALARSLIGELLAPCRNELSECTCSDLVPLAKMDLCLHWRWRCACVCWCVGCVCVCVCVVVWLLSGGLSSMRCLLYLDIQSRRGGIIGLPFEALMVTPVVCPRLLEILTTMTFGAQRRNQCQQHLRPSQKKKQRHGKLVVQVQFVKNTAVLEGKCVSVGVDALAAVL